MIHCEKSLPGETIYSYSYYRYAIFTFIMRMYALVHLVNERGSSSSAQFDSANSRITRMNRMVEEVCRIDHVLFISYTIVLLVCDVISYCVCFSILTEKLYPRYSMARTDTYSLGHYQVTFLLHWYILFN
jgi:hypothetical protein